jgi:phage shock protein E
MEDGKLKTMTWISPLIVIVLLGVLLAIKRGGQISTRTAAQLLQRGAVVIDVRSAGEYTARHLPRAVNIPLSEIEKVIERKVSDKNQVILLHCQTGARSNEAKSRLRVMGYGNTYNLGSYARAAQVLRTMAD